MQITRKCLTTYKLQRVTIVKEAGGYVEFIDERASQTIKKNVIATNSAIHEELKHNILKKIIE